MNLALGVIYAIITSLYAPYGASISFLLLPDIMVENMGFKPICFSACKADDHIQQSHSPTKLVAESGLEPEIVTVKV